MFAVVYLVIVIRLVCEYCSFGFFDRIVCAHQFSNPILGIGDYNRQPSGIENIVS